MSYINKSRINKEDKYYNNHIISLTAVKRNMMRNVTNFDKINIDFFKSNKCSDNKFEKQMAYLHFLILFMSHREVHEFFKYFYNKYGFNTSYLFINYPLVNIIDKNIITPLQCALLWCNDPRMVRVLYHWGADVSAWDVNGRYPEEFTNIYYVNHLYPYILSNIIIYGIRIKNDFHDITNELLYITGEKAAPDNWEMPKRFYQENMGSSK